MAEYVMTDEELRRVQMIQLEMLCEVDRICKKNNIRYNIIAGTLLGAVRHKGYIPWDDDADVALLRGEYRKFRKSVEKDLDNSRFYFQDHQNTEGYRWGYGKLRRKNTVFVREGQEDMPYEQGIFIDIFPLDYVSDHRFIRSISNIHCFMIRKCMWAPIGRRQEKNIVYRCLYRFLSYIPDRILFTHYDRYVRAKERKRTEWVRILTFPTPNSQFGYLTTWYENSNEIEFEGIKFDGIKNKEEYLEFKFGNYMCLPKESERKKHSVSKFGINI